MEAADGRLADTSGGADAGAIALNSRTPGFAV